jgi:sugar phosphate permease
LAGSLILVIDVPIALFVVKKKPEDMGLLADNEVPSQLVKPPESAIKDDVPESNLMQTTPIITTSLSSYLKKPALWLLSFGFLFANIGEMGVVVHEVSYLTDIGLAVTVAAGALGFTGAIGGFGKLFFGYLTEKISVRYAIMICFTVQAIGVFILMMVDTNAALLWIFVLVFGFAFGGVITLMPLAVVALFPLSALGVIFGFVHFVFISGVLIGPPLAGLAYDLSGSYTTAFTGFIGSFLLAVVFIYFAWGKNPKLHLKSKNQKIEIH